MKSIINKYFFTGLSFVLVSTFFTACSSEREITSVYSQDQVSQAVSNNRWNFVATNAMPLYGNNRNLGGDYYFVRFTKDTVTVALPYYGKLNSPAGAREGNPMDFRSTNFTFTKEDKKGGGWLLSVNRPDPEVQSMNFTLFDNGSARLDVVMTNRTGISYTGKVEPIK